MTKRIICAVLLAIIISSLAGLAGCIEKGEESVKIGAIYPLSGSFAATGADVKNGILLAADIINNEYDLDLPLARSKGIDSLNGAKVELVFGDSQGYPTTGKSEAERLINDDAVVALLGCYKSAVAADVCQIAEDNGIPFLTDQATAPSLTRQGLNWFFRTTPNEETFVRNFYVFLNDARNAMSIDVETLGIVSENSIWGTEIAEYEVQYAREYGYRVVESISYASDTADVRSEVRRLKNARPDVVMQASYINDAILYMQTYKAQNFCPDAIMAANGGFNDPEFVHVLGADANFILTREVWSRDLAATKPLVGTVNQMFKERYGTDMDGNSARAFTGMLVLAESINRAGSSNPEAIRNALLDTNMPADVLIMPWDGIRFDPKTHQNILGKGIICQVIDQDYYTVWPGNLATKELIWPMPTWEEREKANVAIVFDTGGLDGFNKVCLSGAKKAEEELKIELDYVVAKTIQEFDELQRGYAGAYDIIICTGSNQADALCDVSKEFAEQKFVLVDGTVSERENVASLLFRDEESSFLAGALAAMVSETNKTGFVGGMDIPVITRFLAGYYAGARYINPDCEIIVSYVGSWNNPERGKELALELYDNGVEVVFGAAGASGVGVIEAAEERDLYAICADTDKRNLAPDNVLVSTLKSTDVAVFDVIKDVVDGDFEGGIHTWGLKEGGVGLSLDNALPIVTDEKKEEIREIREEIIDGGIEIPLDIDVYSKRGMTLLDGAI
ncbi:membrane lipoprotein, substrate-binding protein [Methanophagales archaeon]|nr:membrane lipoprotein, substrate-binding protein [Methanophagales archaeon]